MRESVAGFNPRPALPRGDACGKVLPCGFALEAAQHVEVACRGQRAQGSGQIPGCPCYLPGFGVILALARATQQYLPAVADLAGDHVACHVEREKRVARPVELGAAQQHIAGDRPFEPCLEATVAVEHDQRNTLVRGAVHERR